MKLIRSLSKIAFSTPVDVLGRGSMEETFRTEVPKLSSKRSLTYLSSVLMSFGFKAFNSFNLSTDVRRSFILLC